MADNPVVVANLVLPDGKVETIPYYKNTTTIKDFKQLLSENYNIGDVKSFTLQVDGRIYHDDVLMFAAAGMLNNKTVNVVRNTVATVTPKNVTQEQKISILAHMPRVTIKVRDRGDNREVSKDISPYEAEYHQMLGAVTGQEYVTSLYSVVTPYLQ